MLHDYKLNNLKGFIMNIPTGKWVIDPSHTTVGFSVRHLMISKVKGSFGAFNGEVITTGDPTDTTLVGTVDTTSITTNDENRDAHVRSADFFDVEKFPEMSFSSTRTEVGKNDTLLVHGNLTIKDATHPVIFNVEFGGTMKDGYGNTKAAAEATARINRTDFGLNWNSPLETGGVLLSEDVNIMIDAQLTLQEPTNVLN